jgi:hypothetical protein
MLPVCLGWFIDARMLSVNGKMAFPMAFPFLIPNCSGTKILFTYRYWFNLLNISVSEIFEKDINNESGM